MPAQFPTLLKSYRERRGIAQKAMAAEVGLSPSMIALLELGERRPTRDQILRIADSLHLTPPEADSLLVAGGQLPLAYDRTPPSDPDLLLAASFLGNSDVPLWDRQRLRLLIRLLCLRKPNNENNETENEDEGQLAANLSDVIADISRLETSIAGEASPASTAVDDR